MELVSVITVNWNGKKWLKDFIDSVLAQTYSDIEIIAVDNNSTDGSKEIIRENYPQVLLIENTTNQGYSKAVNSGINIAKGEFILPLNTDVVLKPNFIEEMVKAAKKDPAVGSVSGKLWRVKESTEEQKVIDSVGHVMYKNRLAFNLGESELDEGQFDDYQYIFGVSGAAPLYKRKMLEDIQIDGEFYDESFFAFWEDIDLDWRAKLRGWKSIYTPHALAYHFRGGIRFPRPKLIEWNNYRNRYFTMIKNDDWLNLLVNLPQVVFTDLLKSGALVFRCPSALLSWFDVIKMGPEMISKRRVIQKKRVVDRKETNKWFEKFNYRKWIKRHLRAGFRPQEEKAEDIVSQEQAGGH